MCVVNQTPSTLPLMLIYAVKAKLQLPIQTSLTANIFSKDSIQLPLNS